MKSSPEHVQGPVFSHDLSGVDHPQRVALDIELGEGLILPGRTVVLDEPVGPPEGIEVGDGGGVGMLQGELCRPPLGPWEKREALCEPAGALNRIVFVPRLLSPSIELHSAFRAVGKLGADETSDGIVVEEGGDAPFDEIILVFVRGGGAEEWLVLADDVAFVVEYRASRSHPTICHMPQDQGPIWISKELPIGTSQGRLPWLGLDLLHHLSAEAACVGEENLVAGIAWTMLLLCEGIAWTDFRAFRLGLRL